MNPIDEHAQAQHLEYASFSPVFWVCFRIWLRILLITIAVVLFHHYGAQTMPHDQTPPPAPAGEHPKPKDNTLQNAIQRFANAVITMGTHPDTGMFFFDAQELTVNEKLETLKTRALVDLLCAKGIIQRHEFENRLEQLVNQAAQKLEDGAKRIALTARISQEGGVNGSGHG